MPIKTNELSGKKYRAYIRFKIAIIFMLAILTFAALVLSLVTGAAGLPVSSVIKALLGSGDKQTMMIVWNLRMPRLITAAISGIGLAVVGCVLQSVLKNPMASASTLGVSQGAAFGAAFAIVILGAGASLGANVSTYTINNPLPISLCAFIGSMISTLVIGLLTRIKSLRTESMILAGVALSTLFYGGTAIIQYFGDQAQVASIVYWTFGSLDNTTWDEITLIIIVTFAAVLFFIYNRWNYTAFLSGETTAKGLGVNVDRLRIVSMLVCSITAAVITAFVGVLNFIGLIAPHIIRRIIGSDYRFLVPASALMGAVLLLFSDILSRTLLSPQILPIGAITSFVGAPLFLYLVYKEGRRR